MFWLYFFHEKARKNAEREREPSYFESPGVKMAVLGQMDYGYKLMFENVNSGAGVYPSCTLRTSGYLCYSQSHLIAFLKNFSNY